jgi:type IV secretory pathway VirB4 component
MKKSIIIIGSQGSGKSTKIKELVSQFSANQVVRINPERIKSEIKKTINIETQVFVVEGISELEQIHEIQKYAKNGFAIYENEQEPSTVYPRFIVSTANLCHDELTFFEEDFEIIETHYDSHFNSNINIKTMQNSFTISTKSVPNDTLETTLNRLFVGYNQSQMSESMDAVERTQVADDFLQIQQIVRGLLAQLPAQNA